MSVEAAREKFVRLAQSATGAGAQISENGKPLISDNGKLLAHSVYPDEFEFYMLGFELIDNSMGKRTVVDRFIFPINPKSIKIGEQKIMSISKSTGGLSAFINNSFEPKNISMTGTFGRRFRLLVGNKEDPTSQAEGYFTGNPGTQKAFVPNIKTGYGTTKRLERLYRKSTRTKDGSPYYVVFYNLAFNEAFFVEFRNFEVTMSEENNMLWQYSISLTAVAPATSTVGRIRGKLAGGAIGLANRRLNRTSDMARRMSSRSIAESLGSF